MYIVYLKNLEFYGYHGVSEEERAVGHRFVASVWLKVDGKADQSDRVEDTADYGEIAECILRAQSSAQCHTVEKLARLMGEALLEEFALASEVEIELGKINPPIKHQAAEAGVRLVLTKA